MSGTKDLASYLLERFHRLLIQFMKKTDVSNVCFLPLKDGASFYFCAYVLPISGYSGFLRNLPTNTTIFLRGLRLCGKSRYQQGLSESKKKIGGNHAFFRDNWAKIWKETARYILCISTLF